MKRRLQAEEESIPHQNSLEKEYTVFGKNLDYLK